VRSRSFAAICVSTGLVVGCFEGGGGLTSTPTTEVIDASVPTDASTDSASRDASATSRGADAGHTSDAEAQEETSATGQNVLDPPAPN
jgi:hypothetical protein